MWVFQFDPEHCIGCQSCQMACTDRKGLEPGLSLRTVISREKQGGPQFFSQSCRHCPKPRCVAACPVGAVYRRADGAVALLLDECIGCRSCIRACPFDVPVYSKVSRRCHKCDSCGDDRDRGGEPACVAACPTGCLRAGEGERI